MVEKQDAVADEAETQEVRGALLLELENVGANGREVTYKNLKTELAGLGIDLTPGLFSKHLLQPSMRLAVVGLLATSTKGAGSEEKVVADTYEKIKTEIDSGKAQDAAIKLISEAKRLTAAVGAVSALDHETASALATRMGIDDPETAVRSFFTEEKSSPSADTWLKLARGLSVPPGLCVAVGTSSASCKAALAAGMRSVAMPDRFTSFQDYSGTDLVADSLDDLDLDAILVKV